MKYLLILVLSCSIVACKKSNNSKCFKIKFIEGICATNVYQILDSEYYQYGENNWTGSNGLVYDHVFLLENPCRTITLAADKTATVSIDNSNSDWCVTCLATISVPPPTKRLNVKVCE